MHVHSLVPFPKNPIFAAPAGRLIDDRGAIGDEAWSGPQCVGNFLSNQVPAGLQSCFEHRQSRCPRRVKRKGKIWPAS
jgi:hypothetical protein